MWNSSGELRFPRERKHKLPVFLRSGLWSPRMFVFVPECSPGQTQGLGQPVFKGRRKTPDVKSDVNTQGGEALSAAIFGNDLPTVCILCLCHLCSVFYVYIREFWTIFTPSLSLLSIFFSLFLVHWFGCFLLLTEFFFFSSRPLCTLTHRIISVNLIIVELWWGKDSTWGYKTFLHRCKKFLLGLRAQNWTKATRNSAPS